MQLWPSSRLFSRVTATARRPTVRPASLTRRARPAAPSEAAARSIHHGHAVRPALPAGRVERAAERVHTALCQLPAEAPPGGDRGHPHGARRGLLGALLGQRERARPAAGEPGARHAAAAPPAGLARALRRGARRGAGAGDEQPRRRPLHGGQGERARTAAPPAQVPGAVEGDRLVHPYATPGSNPRLALDRSPHAPDRSVTDALSLASDRRGEHQHAPLRVGDGDP
eukprot:scaffold85162_cov42-Phaeocystis_antarctica.AAC.2